MSNSNAFILSQLHGEAKALDRFVEAFKSFADSDQKFMTVYETTAVGGKKEVGWITASTKEELAKAIVPVESNTIYCRMYVFEWDLGINLIESKLVD